MAGGARKLVIVCLAAVMVAAAAVMAAEKHVVGGSTGWTIPSGSSFYSDWASTQNFIVGDSLVFDFTSGLHTVAEVDQSSYGSCSTSNVIGSPLTNGPATLTLTSAGSHYYICSVVGHCPAGMKLAITVSAAPPHPSAHVSSPPPPPPPHPSANVSSPPPPPAKKPPPSPSPSSSSPPPSPTSSPSPSSSSPPSPSPAPSSAPESAAAPSSEAPQSAPSIAPSAPPSSNPPPPPNSGKALMPASIYVTVLLIATLVLI